jgi:hypothetical protein
MSKAEQDAAARRRTEELLRQRAAANPAPATNPRLPVPQNYKEVTRGSPNPNHSATYIHGTNKQKGVPSKARGGHVPHEMPDGRMCYACAKDGMHMMPDGTMMRDSDHYQGYDDGGFIEQAKELYDVAQNFPEEFEKAYTGFKGEFTKIYDWWKDVLGFRRGGHVAFKR